MPRDSSAGETEASKAALLIAGIGGIGAELFKKALAAGKFGNKPIGRIVVVDFYRDDAALDAAKAKLVAAGAAAKIKVDVLRWNAAVFSSTEEVCAKLKQDASLPRVYDAVIVTTGLGYHGNLAKVPLAETNAAFQRLMQVNCTGPSLLLTFLATHLMRQRIGHDEPPPVILVMSSYSGLVGLPDRAAYCASKFALNGFAESLYADMRQLRVVLVCPTSVDTNFRDNWRKQLGEGAAGEAAPEQQKAKRGFFTRLTDGSSEVTLEKSVSMIWSAFESAAFKRTGGVDYVAFANFWGNLAYKLAREWDYSRSRILDKADRQGAKL